VTKYSDLSRPQLLEVLRRYDAALCLVAGKLADEETRHTYRKRSGTGLTDLEWGRLAAYKETARIAIAVRHGNMSS
jgi:hypothetical protein